MPDERRNELLARRVRWLDRNRRRLGIVVGLVIAATITFSFYDASAPTVQQYHGGWFGLLAGFLTWISLEVGLAWLSAVWETELSDRGLARAVIHRPKTKTGAEAPVSTVDERESAS